MSADPVSSNGVTSALAPLHRRAFLRLAGAVAATSLLPSGCGAVPSELAPPPESALEVLSPRAYATFRAFSIPLVGRELAGQIRARTLDPAGLAERRLARQPALGEAVKQGLFALEWGVWPLLPEWRPFTALGDAAQDRVLADLSGSRIDLLRDLFRGLESLATLAVYTQPAVRRALGDPGPFDAQGIAIGMAELKPR